MLQIIQTQQQMAAQQAKKWFYCCIYFKNCNTYKECIIRLKIKNA